MIELLVVGVGVCVVLVSAVAFMLRRPKDPDVAVLEGGRRDPPGSRADP